MDSRTLDYDIIIAGGGLAGMIVATSAAFYSNQNMRILVVDRNPEHELGKKTISGWICGDAVGKNSVDFMTSRIGIKWESPEIEHPVKGVKAYSPDHSTSVSFDGEGYILNRKLLPQKQLRDALRLGIEIRNDIALRNLVAENGAIVGVEGQDMKNKVPFKMKSKVVIDCTGVTSVLRTNLSIRSFIQRRIDRDDLEATGRYIYSFDKGSEDKSFFDSDYCLIHLDQTVAPGGYAWVFPKGQNKVNIGLGIQQKSLDNFNRANRTNKNLKMLIDEYVRINPVFRQLRVADAEEDSGNGWGTWQVSVRRQNDCMVANGYMIVGDSAWMPKPLDAGGIGPAIIAATLAGMHAVNAVESGDCSERSLWSYSKDFIDCYGYKTAGLEVFRRMLQGLNNDQINYGMKHFLSKFDIDKITNGEHPEFSMVDRVSLFVRGAINKRLADDLKHTAEVNKKLVDHYHNYPIVPEKFIEWERTLSNHLSDAMHHLEHP